MNADTYQELAHQTSMDTEIGAHTLTYPIMGLVSEVGELAGKWKKIWRDQNGIMGDADYEDFAHELGDILWYTAEVATQLGWGLSAIMGKNIEKLEGRARRGTIQGSGDYR